MTSRRASCSCGGLTVLCQGDPVRVSMCHCLACQQRTGSAFAVQARFAAERVTVQGPFSEYAHTGDSGSTATFRFCPTCGSKVCWESDALPGFVTVAVGAFADPSFPAPTVSVYGVRRHPWAALPETIEDEWD